MLKINQMERIFTYNEERNLTVYREEKELSYKIEEIDEYFKAQKEGSVHGMIDALCDLTVFACGVMFKNSMEARNVLKHDFMNEMKHIVYGLESELRCIKVAMRMIDDLGYDPTKCMDEVIRHIESRKGEVNEETGKFEKYTDEHHVSLWYEPNYESCKYVKENIYAKPENTVDA